MAKSTVNKNEQQKIEHVLQMARDGKLGTPEQPNMNQFGFANFWRAYKGWYKASSFKNTISYPYAKAAELYKKEQEN